MNIKACPLCNSMEKVYITPEEFYDKCIKSWIEEFGEEGQACISVTCDRCALQITEYGKADYHTKLETLIKKWNALPRKEEHVDDGK